MLPAATCNLRVLLFWYDSSKVQGFRWEYFCSRFSCEDYPSKGITETLIVMWFPTEILPYLPEALMLPAHTASQEKTLNRSQTGSGQQGMFWQWVWRRIVSGVLFWFSVGNGVYPSGSEGYVSNMDDHWSCTSKRIILPSKDKSYWNQRSLHANPQDLHQFQLSSVLRTCTILLVTIPLQWWNAILIGRPVEPNLKQKRFTVPLLTYHYLRCPWRVHRDCYEAYFCRYSATHREIWVLDLVIANPLMEN